MYNRFNFFKYTFAVFTKVQEPEGFVKPHYTSKHGSRYFFNGSGVFRYSNHWGRVGNCRWRLDGIDYRQQLSCWGFCSWDRFYANNELQACFFVEQVGDNRFTYNHLDNAAGRDVVGRTAADAAKVLKKISEINEDSGWARHLDYEDYDELRTHFIKQLMETRKTFSQIRQEYLLAKK